MGHVLVNESLVKPSHPVEDTRITEYLDARNAFLKLDKKVDQIAAKINNVGHTLMNWRNMFLFSNCKVELSEGYLKDLQDKNYDAESWPTPELINETLTIWHKANNRQKHLWKNIPPEIRKDLDAPF